jgi:GNAT superfamily N-acetyltransferase
VFELTCMDKYPQLAVFPEVSGELVHRPEVNTPPRRKLSREERQLGPSCNLSDGIYIVTVSANTPHERFDAAHLLNLASHGKRSTHANGFIPTDNYDSAVAVVNGRVVGGVIADRERVGHLHVRLRSNSARALSGPRRLCPIVFDLWVHPAHRRRRLAQQLLLAMASHFRRSVGELGFRVPISTAAVHLLRSMGLTEILGWA